MCLTTKKQKQPESRPKHETGWRGDLPLDPYRCLRSTPLLFFLFFRKLSHLQTLFLSLRTRYARQLVPDDIKLHHYMNGHTLRGTGDVLHHQGVVHLFRWSSTHSPLKVIVCQRLARTTSLRRRFETGSWATHYLGRMHQYWNPISQSRGWCYSTYQG